jgi:hypothetical protein
MEIIGAVRAQNLTTIQNIRVRRIALVIRFVSIEFLGDLLR